MNIRYTITWPNQREEQPPSRFYDSLRAGVARNNSLPGGVRFPFDCPYEVALACGRGEQPVWIVSVLAVQVPPAQAVQIEDTQPLLLRWFEQCCPGGLPAEASLQAASASHLKLASELGFEYEIIDSFGTFAGEPALEDLPREALSAKPEQAAPGQPAQPATRAVPAKPASAPQAVAGPTTGAASLSRDAGPGPVAIPSKDTSSGLASCLRLGLIAAGVMLVPVSLALGAILALGQTSPETASSPGELILLTLCCPAPVLVLGIGLIVFGAVLPRLVKPNNRNAVHR